MQLIKTRAATKASEHHLCHFGPQVNLLTKNPTANSLQSHITNLQLPNRLSAQEYSRALHYLSNPFYSIMVLSQSFSISRPSGPSPIQGSPIEPSPIL